MLVLILDYYLAHEKHVITDGELVVRRQQRGGTRQLTYMYADRPLTQDNTSVRNC